MGHLHSQKQRLHFINAEGPKCPLPCWKNDLIVTATILISTDRSLESTYDLMRTHGECP
ncbi:hypothetical protein LB558_15540 [Mesorhizobium sp. CO1-1-8]|nr:hypothetical protein [Mesorhizobium sp. CO1-1-8]MBZ9773938.1 hypothetical protein [Mesorhizobium sp. CO1-1-8]